jgi:hypothetical protein
VINLLREQVSYRASIPYLKSPLGSNVGVYMGGSRTCPSSNEFCGNHNGGTQLAAGIVKLLVDGQQRITSLLWCYDLTAVSPPPSGAEPRGSSRDDQETAKWC